MSSIKFIGTGSGKVSTNRFHSSFLINTEKFNLLVDSGDGVSKALLAQKIDFNFIDGILISHLHPDHYSGLPSLIVQMKINNRDKDLMIFTNIKNINFIKEFISNSYLFLENLGFTIYFTAFDDDEVVHVSDNFNFLSKQNSHLDEYKKYDKKNELEFSCGSFLFRINKCEIFYTGDIGAKEDLYLFKDFKIDYIISESAHVNLEVILLAFNQLKAKKLFLTHISDEVEFNLSKLKIPSSSNKEKITAAFDGLEFSV